MAGQNDIRWKQRLDNFGRALRQMEKFMAKADTLNELEEQGLIQSFEYCYELAWNTLKDFYVLQGETNIQGSRDAIILAHERGLIENGELWMNMLKDRNRSAHSYNGSTATAIRANITAHYFGEFIRLETRFLQLAE